MTVYDFMVKDKNGNEVSLAEYKGKVLLIVNTATMCGFTPQYEGLESLYQEFHEKGFEILDFPCNQFGKQAPDSIDVIDNFCQLNYKTTFPRFAKVEVNGSGEDALFAYLKKEQSGILGSAIKWNFTKFLVDKNGKPVARFASTDKPEKLRKEIEKLLG